MSREVKLKFNNGDKVVFMEKGEIRSGEIFTIEFREEYDKNRVEFKTREVYSVLKDDGGGSVAVVKAEDLFSDVKLLTENLISRYEKRK